MGVMEQKYRGFMDLECWKKARELRMKISNLTKKFPASEKYMLTKQIIESSRSVTRNIAEGYGRFTYTDTRHFFIQARGSGTETMDHLTVALDENYLIQDEFIELMDLSQLVFKLINGYIDYLDRQRAVIRKP